MSTQQPNSDFSTKKWIKIVPELQHKVELFKESESNMQDSLEEIRSKYRISAERFVSLVDEVSKVVINYEAMDDELKYKVLARVLNSNGREVFKQFMKEHLSEECVLIANPPMDISEFDLDNKVKENISKKVNSQVNKLSRKELKYQKQ